MIRPGHCRSCGEPALHHIEARTPNPRHGKDSYRATQACHAHLKREHRWAAAAGHPTVVRIANPPQGDLFGGDAA